MEEKILYFDCLAGISGDMTIGALLDLGIDNEKFIEELEKLNIDGYELEIKNDQKNGITGTDFNVIIKEHHQHNHSHDHDHHAHSHVHRNLKDIEEIIDASQLNNYIKDLSKKIFKFVAESEAKIHNKDINNVHFHEVGAIDSIVDIVGTAICIDMLEFDKIYASPLHIGTGFVNCAHGNIPVPAPATLEILKGVEVYSTGIKSELVTPTGAAIIKALAEEFIPIPNMTMEKIGYGLGKKDLEITNVLRIYMGKKKLTQN
ncbi:nickel pincer cofactor biosynthesis protein LarC [Clostridiisalibacter paucivorans]|uniref:nickel pincer cofactor biosynthesis protein LarC n=1 Tax=Clostridiisalibacter paucivorans TaxID=408753 RepID=UPI00047C3CCE|nr:nickel pincer cofactor biosynthesis protein LarC [Clostridiisalibacter paucivorans]